MHWPDSSFVFTFIIKISVFYFNLISLFLTINNVAMLREKPTNEITC